MKHLNHGAKALLILHIVSRRKTVTTLSDDKVMTNSGVTFHLVKVASVGTKGRISLRVFAEVLLSGFTGGGGGEGQCSSATLCQRYQQESSSSPTQSLSA